MKKIFMAAMTLVMAVFASCSNEDLNVENNDVKVKFTVAEKPGFGADSRSVKKGWDNDDQILVVFRGADGSWLDAFDDANTLKLTKTADGWTPNKSKLDISKLGSSDDYMAFYYPGEVSFASSDESGILYFDTYKGGEYLTAEGTYTVNGSDIELGTISMTRDKNMYQISVKGLASESGNWTLSVQQSNGNKIYDSHLASGVLRVGIFEYNTTINHQYDNASGVSYNNDVQFCFIKNSSSYQAPGKFVLSNGIKTYELERNLQSTSLQGGCAYSLPAIAEWTELEE